MHPPPLHPGGSGVFKWVARVELRVALGSDASTEVTGVAALPNSFEGGGAVVTAGSRSRKIKKKH